MLYVALGGLAALLLGIVLFVCWLDRGQPPHVDEYDWQ